VFVERSGRRKSDQTQLLSTQYDHLMQFLPTYVRLEYYQVKDYINMTRPYQ